MTFCFVCGIDFVDLQQHVRENHPGAEVPAVAEEAVIPDLEVGDTKVSPTKTFPSKAMSININDYIIVDGRPCKVSDISNPSSSKVRFTAKDIFTRETVDATHHPTHMIDVPYVTKVNYLLCDISSDGFLTLLDDSCVTRSDIRLPRDQNLSQTIEAGFHAGKELRLKVTTSMGREEVTAIKSTVW